VLPLAAFSSALQMLIATYARSFKEALSQTLLLDEIMRGTAELGPFFLALLGCAVGTVICLKATTRLLADEKIIFGR
jgi:sodium transport system permease protein